MLRAIHGIASALGARAVVLALVGAALAWPRPVYTHTAYWYLQNMSVVVQQIENDGTAGARGPICLPPLIDISHLSDRVGPVTAGGTPGVLNGTAMQDAHLAALAQQIRTALITVNSLGGSYDASYHKVDTMVSGAVDAARAYTSALAGRTVFISLSGPG